MQNQGSFQEQCDAIISWRTGKLSPEALFSLPEATYFLGSRHPINIPYTEEDINKAYKRLALKFHPDRNSLHKDLASSAFDVIKDAQNYLLYTVKRNADEIRDNPFYLYYHEDNIVNRTKEDLVDNMIKEGYRLKSDNQDMTRVVQDLIEQLSSRLDLVHYECDNSNIWNFTTGGKTVIYAAAQWNEPFLFNWLLEHGADPLAKTPFGVSPLDIAISSEHRNILVALKDSPYFGVAKLKAAMEQLCCINENGNSDKLLQYYLDFFKDDVVIEHFSTQFPLMTPALHHLNYLNHEDAFVLYKKTIIGHPELYKKLNDEERADLFILVATLAQDRSSDLLRYIPTDTLKPALITALCDVWPEIKPHINSDFSSKPASNLPGFQSVQYALIATIFCIVMLVLAYHFWPLMSLYLNPGLVFTSLMVPLTLGAVGMMITPALAYDYATKVYPETRAIQKLLVEHNFFQPATHQESDTAMNLESVDSEDASYTT